MRQDVRLSEICTHIHLAGIFAGQSDLRRVWCPTFSV